MVIHGCGRGYCLRQSTWKLLLAIPVMYILTWLIFATMYWAISNIGSVDCQLHDDAGSPFSFLDGIYFSMETQVRVSYCIGWSWAVGA